MKYIDAFYSFQHIFCLFTSLRWEFQRSFGGQLCHEYLYQNLSKSGYAFSGYNWQSRGFFDVFRSSQCLFRVHQYSQVVQKQTLGEVGTWTAVWWPVVSGIIVPKITKIWISFFQVTINNVRDPFLGHSVDVQNYTAWPLKCTELQQNKYGRRQQNEEEKKIIEWKHFTVKHPQRQNPISEAYSRAWLLERAWSDLCSRCMTE